VKLLVALIAGTFVFGLAALAVGQQPSVAPAAHVATTPAVLSSPSLKEQRKLDLEVDKLEKETSGWAEFRAWLPAGTIVAGVIAALVSIVLYFGEKRFKTRVRLEEQFNENLQAISDYSERGRSTSSRVVRALRGLEQIAPLTADPAAHIRAVTDVITAGVRHDASFESFQQARFDGLCLAGWPDYGRWLDDHPLERRFILYRYQQALRGLAARYPEHFRTMSVGTSGLVVDEFVPEEVHLHFTALADGYRRQVERLTDASQRQEAISAFGEALNNARLACTMLENRTT
jgi:hypothetical protein